ncbi:ATP-binding protein [Metabacillus indicus]|uniref:ATP-binding protein n=1 Tax=Metabacillus indicus TaxID=246786 RepID=UPI00317DE71B
MEMQLIASKYDKIPFPYFLVDRKLNIVSVSRCTFTIFDEELNFLDVVGIGSKKKAAKFILDTPSITKIELNLKTKSNPMTLFDVYIQYEGKNFIHIFCIDKEESVDQIYQAVKTLEGDLLYANLNLLEKQEQLEKSLQQMKEIAIKQDSLATVGQIAASIAHEIRNPLTSVKGFLQLLKPHLIEIGKGHYADVALEELNRANEIIYEFLNNSKTPLETKQPVLLSKLLNDIVLICKSEAILTNCELTCSIIDEEVYLHVDIKQMKQVMLNMMRNAMEAIQLSKQKKSGNISITTRLDSGRIVIQVKDNGIGMNQDTLNSLFKPFFTTKEQGTGIGLSVCKEIIKANSGSIDVISEEGFGSVFSISLPVK